jgi:hypothetical protein
MALTPEAELEIRRQVESEIARYGTEAQAYRSHLETVFRNVLYGMGILGALAAILFTYFFSKTSSDIANQAKAQIDERVLDYKVKEEVRERLKVVIEQETTAPAVIDTIRKRIDELAKAAVATNAKGTISDAIKQELPKLTNLSPDQIREDISRTLPVGSVTASFLPPEDFYRLANREGAPVTWQLADGSPSGETLYKKLTGQTNLPDLRGKFLRGLNVGLLGDAADPDLNRKPGDYQPDAFEKHSHTYGTHSEYANGSQNAFGAQPGPAPFKTSEAGTATETRPKNIAVYYYIKIN